MTEHTPEVATPTATKGSRWRAPRALRWVFAPLLAYLALAVWAFASPIGAGPDDDYHLISVWCASGDSALCQPGSEPDTRILPDGFWRIFCYASQPEVSAECQVSHFPNEDQLTYETRRGNFYGEYPPLFYATMSVFAGDDVQFSAMVMRLVNAAIFVGLATALAWLLPGARQRTVLWGWLITLMPLGMFLIPSNNPSGWAITGVGTAFLALLGWFESTGRRQWILGAMYLVGVLMAAGSRGDAAVYAIGASVTVMILSALRKRRWMVKAALPLVGMAIAVVFMSMANQAGIVTEGFSDSGGATNPITGEDGVGEPLSGLGLAAYNLLMLPYLWTGVFGTWGLGWIDTTLPALVPAAAVAAFVVVGFAGLGMLTWRKAISLAGVFVVLLFMPVYVLTTGGDMVGTNLQPRYLLPLIVLFGFLLVYEPRGARLRFTRFQTFLVLGALAIANFVSLQVNIRRYVTGADQQGPNLDAGAEWWWPGALIGPQLTWILGSLAFIGLLAVLWKPLRSPRTSAEYPAIEAVEPVQERAGA